MQELAKADVLLPAKPEGGKINLPGGVVQELIKADILPPANKEDIQRVLKELRDKLTWYKDNQDQKTKEVKQC